jgi:hypothetical protein
MSGFSLANIVVLSTAMALFPNVARAKQSKSSPQEKSTPSSQAPKNRAVTLKSLLEGRHVTTMNDVKSDKTSAKREAVFKQEQELLRTGSTTPGLVFFHCGVARKEAPK